MGQNQRVRQRLSLLGAWQLGLFAASVVATTGFHGDGGAADLVKTPPANTLNLDLQTTIFQSHEQCPKPGPCYRSAETEFCVFTANASDHLGFSKVVPMVTAPERAMKLMSMLSEAAVSKRERSSKPNYTVSPITGKGLGVISTGELERGDHILSDLPTLIIDHCMMARVPQYRLASLMNEAVNRLPIPQLDRVMSLDVLGDEAPDEHYLVGRIYATSAYMLDPDGVLFGVGCGIGALFPEGEHKHPSLAGVLYEN